MITGKCDCGHSFSVPESALNQVIDCQGCRRKLYPLAAEQLADGAGEGDFDAALRIHAGPSRLGDQIFLGGVVDIEIGKLTEKHISLVGAQVSRNHAKLSRIDFGPSRWKIVDNKSTNGIFINGTRITEHELQSGDTITIGDFDLKYSIAGPEEVIEEAVEAEEVEAAAAQPAMARGGAAVMTPPLQSRAGARSLGYATPGLDAGRLLGQCDPQWVEKLRLASRLLLSAVVLNFISGTSSKLADSDTVGLVLGAASAAVNMLAAWLLTTAEPDVPEEQSNQLVRMALRIVAMVAGAGQLLLVLSTLTHNFTLILVGLGLCLAALPQFFLLLFYIRKLAKRIPNETLATQCMIVMIGLPASVGMLIATAAIAIISKAPAATGIFGLCIGVLGLLVFAIWYLILLIWFRRSLT